MRLFLLPTPLTLQSKCEQRSGSETMGRFFPKLWDPHGREKTQSGEARWGPHLFSLGWLVLVAALMSLQSAAAQDWPTPTNVNQPWTRWWWHGSAVDEENLTRSLEAYHASGIGGVEITPIYGVRGEDSREVPYLSPRWIELVNYAIAEAKRLGMGVDLPPGTGWRMGGPWVKPEDGNAEFDLKLETLTGGSTYSKDIGEDLPEAVVANGPEGEVVELTNQIDDQGKLQWEAPEGEWTVSVLRTRLLGEKVKRPAPGGEGLNINPYAANSTLAFLDALARQTSGLTEDGIRCSFHDSFEYEGNWCDDFQKYWVADYPLEHHLPALAGKGEEDYVARVKSDFRDTISRLVLTHLIEPWVNWSHENGMLARNQAHGSPGNWLDLYAACDIPETESFGRINSDPLRHYFFKFASSAAHVAGRPLVSSETATWLDEHFHVTLEEVKWIVDLELLNGVNHVFFHGTAYSPQDAEWPGWAFYASTQLNPRNPIWRDLPALNEYITRCQSLLQAGQPDNDVLVYWPIYDIWHNPRGLSMKLTVHNGRQWFGRSSLYEAAQELDDQGVTYDFVSDLQLAKCRCEGDRVLTGGSDYSAVLVPKTRLMPLKTIQHLLRLAEGGASIGFQGLPQGTPGLKGLDEQQEFDDLKASLKFEPAKSGLSVAKVGRGEVVLVEDLSAWAELAGCHIESWSKPHEFSFIRRKLDGETVYFVRNESDKPVDAWIAPATSAEGSLLMDPLTGRVGLADKNDSGEFRLQLEPQVTIFLKTVRGVSDQGAWQYRTPVEKEVPITSRWSIEIIEGGPTLPEPVETDHLLSWTKLAGTAGENFAGTARYSTTIDVPEHDGAVWLDLGQVADSARVFLNGRELGVLIGPPFEIELDRVKSGENQLNVEVTNVAANRVRDLDRRKVRWRIFKDINFVNIDYRPFDASNWKVRDAGLLGPVTLKLLKPTD